MSAGVILYKKELMDHFKNPRNFGKIEKADFDSGYQNPSCGDSIIIYGTIEDGKIKTLKFEGKGCAISIASASMLTEKCKGISLEDILKITKDDILDMIDIKLGPTRMRCALISLMALQKGIKSFSEK